MTLKDILADLVDRARIKKGAAHSVTLKHGLRVHLYITRNEQIVRLAISREDVYPSEQEWQTIAVYFPGGIPESAPPMQIEQQGRYWLRATWAREMEG